MTRERRKADWEEIENVANMEGRIRFYYRVQRWLGLGKQIQLVCTIQHLRGLSINNKKY